MPAASPTGAPSSVPPAAYPYTPPAVPGSENPHAVGLSGLPVAAVPTTLPVVPPVSSGASAPRRTRIIGLDGIRALAAALVLCYHLVPGWRGAGFVGVDIFFVLSGFLITALLLREIDTSRQIRFFRFWLRRFRRLLPAVFVATIGAVALARLGGGDSLVQLPWQVTGSLTSTYNWLEIANAAPYFNQGSPLLLTNMWSLAVEMQFYLVWPLLLPAAVVLAPRRAAPYVALVLGGASVALSAYFASQGDITRAYVGTDSHVFGIMLGAAVALWVPGIMSGTARVLPPQQRRVWGYLTWVGLLGALSIGIFVPTGPWMYPWGMVAAAGLAALAVRGLLPDVLSPASSALARFLGSRPMVYLGERSYGIYLWHWPLWVIAFFTLRWSAWPTALLVVAVTLVLAELSYRFIETPIRTQGFLVWISGLRRLPVTRRGILLGVAAVVLGLFVWGVASSPAKTSAVLLVEQGAAAQSGDQQSAEAAAPAPQADEPVAPPGEPTPITGGQVTIIGDSVTLGTELRLHERLPGVFINAEVSRAWPAFPPIADWLNGEGNLRDYVVLALATNGSFTDEDVASMFQKLGPDRKIVLVTGFGPDSDYWITQANEKIAEVAAAHPDQVRVADWRPIAQAHQDHLAGDRVHPDQEAAALYADEVVRALNSFDEPAG